MKKLFTLQLDICHDLPFDEIATMMEHFNAHSLQIINANGPAGGNPFIKLHFTTQADVDAFQTFYDSNEPIHSLS